MPRLLTSTACLESLPTSRASDQPGPFHPAAPELLPHRNSSSWPDHLSTAPCCTGFLQLLRQIIIHLFVAQISLLLVNVEEANEQRSKGPDCTPGSPEAPEMGDLVRPQQRGHVSPRIDPGDSQRAEPIEFLNTGTRSARRLLSPSLCVSTEDCMTAGGAVGERVRSHA